MFYGLKQEKILKEINITCEWSKQCELCSKSERNHRKQNNNGINILKFIPEQLLWWPTQLYLRGKGAKKGGIIIPVYNSHTHSKRTNSEGSHSVHLFHFNVVKWQMKHYFKIRLTLSKNRLNRTAFDVPAARCRTCVQSWRETKELVRLFQMFPLVSCQNRKYKILQLIKKTRNFEYSSH